MTTSFPDPERDRRDDAFWLFVYAHALRHLSVTQEQPVGQHALSSAPPPRRPDTDALHSPLMTNDALAAAAIAAATLAAFYGAGDEAAQREAVRLYARFQEALRQRREERTR